MRIGGTTFELVLAGTEVEPGALFRVDWNASREIPRPTGGTAVFASETGRLVIPTLRVQGDGPDSVFTNVTFQLAGTGRFTLEEMSGPPDIILFNANILTMSDDAPEARALAITGDAVTRRRA